MPDSVEFRPYEPSTRGTSFGSQGLVDVGVVVDGIWHMARDCLKVSDMKAAHTPTSEVSGSANHGRGRGSMATSRSEAHGLQYNQAKERSESGNMDRGNGKEQQGDTQQELAQTLVSLLRSIGGTRRASSHLPNIRYSRLLLQMWDRELPFVEFLASSYRGSPMLSTSRFIYRSLKLQNSEWMQQHGLFSSVSVTAIQSLLSNLHPHNVVVRVPFRNLLARFSTGLPFQRHTSRRFLEMMTSLHAGSDTQNIQNNFLSGKELFGIIKSACYELDGPGHQWLNIFSEVNKLFDKADFFLILVNAFIQGDPLVDHCDRILMIERVKFLQKRYPKLKVIGLQCVGSAKALSIHSEVLKTIMEEYITFPILIVDRKLIKVIDSAVYLFSEGSTGSLSVDEDGGRIFISDCNHHRIIIIDGDGKVLDSV
ncbi:hypothetical protein HPP92_002863 [Vanilla planifolia]|uniref:Uncharacterized protein n=1 Tax=Vanilla planifolia TaxID=51239 RepID=A0A835S2J8_VANPL|nr:hypothetical protein HPP92_002863 [Vanilla planifolia]